MESQPIVIAVGFAVFTALGWLIGIAAYALKGKAWVEETALRTIKSAEGRAAVLDIVTDHNDRIEEKLATLSKAIDQLGSRLESRIDQMSAKLEGRLDRLDKDAHDLDVRMALVEDARGTHRV
jgi:flagellar capping protein FliD